MKQEEIEKKLKLALATAEDAGVDFASYDRRQDEELSTEDLEYLLSMNILTYQDLSRAFIEGIKNNVD